MTGERMVRTDAAGRRWPCVAMGQPYDGTLYVRFDAGGQGAVPLADLEPEAGASDS